MATPELIPAAQIDGTIRTIRGQRVMLDTDLALIYGVLTKNLNLAVRRNRSRFPEDFMFQLTAEEFSNLRLQFATSSTYGGRRYAPYAFTEHGVAMLSGVLKSERAIAVNIEIMRAFIRLRQTLSAHADLSRRLDGLERKYDSQFKAVFDAIRQLMAPPAEPPKPRIGYQTEEQKRHARALPNRPEMAKTNRRR